MLKISIAYILGKYISFLDQVQLITTTNKCPSNGYLNFSVSPITYTPHGDLVKLISPQFIAFLGSVYHHLFGSTLSVPF